METRGLALCMNHAPPFSRFTAWPTELPDPLCGDCLALNAHGSVVSRPPPLPAMRVVRVKEVHPTCQVCERVVAALVYIELPAVRASKNVWEIHGELVLQICGGCLDRAQAKLGGPSGALPGLSDCSRG